VPYTVFLSNGAVKNADHQFVFLRHGIAENARPAQSDEERELTPEGHEQMQQIALGLARAFPNAEAIYASPLVRAQQTAEWVAKAYSLTVETADALSTNATTPQLIAFVQTLDVSRAIFVGHEPSLAGLLAEVIGSDAGIPLKRGGCFCVRVSAGGANLEWLATPDLLS
jgi:phosphohistidine phosphatase